MRLLLDTHVIIWTVNDPAQVPPRVGALLRSTTNHVFVSAAPPWEIAIKVGKGKLAFDRPFLADFDKRMRALAFTPLPMTAVHGVAAGLLPGHHKDPFDGMLVAQAQVEQLAIITRDPALAALGASVIW